MKKLISVLLILAVLFACGCTGEKKDERLKAIEVPSAEKIVMMPDAERGETSLIHLNTSTCGNDARIILYMAYDYFASQGIGSQIKEMYLVGYALDEVDDLIIIKVYFTDEGVQPVYLSVLKNFSLYAPGYAVMGSFRDSDVIGDLYYAHAMDQAQAYADKIKSGLGILRDDTEVLFPVYLLRDLSFSMPTKEHTMLYGDTKSVFDRITIPQWSGSLSSEMVTINGHEYVKIEDPRFTSMASFDIYLHTAFTRRAVSEIKEYYKELFEGDYPMYTEKDGAVYMAPVGGSGHVDFVGAEPKYYALQGDSRMFMLVESTWHVWGNDYSMTDELCYKEQLLIFERQDDGSWKCDYYQSVPKMSFRMSIPLNNESN